VRSPLPVEIKLALKIGVANESVTVTTAGDLVETDPSTHTDVDRQLFDKLLSKARLPRSVLSYARDARVAAIRMASSTTRRPRFEFFLRRRPADHGPAEQSFLESGPGRRSQSMEVIEGAPPAEFGARLVWSSW